VRLFETARAELVEFAPPPVVRMYVCGITPYDSTHLGHAATYLAYDVLIRRLESLGHEVRLVRNFTDVDDSILPKARELGVHYLDLAESEMAKFRADMAALEMRPAMVEPRATEAVPRIVELVDELLRRGHAYAVDGPDGVTVLYDVATFPSFGSLSHYDPAQMVAYAKERGGRPDDPRLRNPLDFVLWQPSAHDEPAWDTPFGPGRPGWHIECTAMATAIHGPTLDLHGGGTDLVFPHHECEIAQTEVLTGQPFVRHWMHSAMVAYRGEKMSKSLGNLVFVSDLLKVADPRAIRLSLLRHHYRAGFEWFDTDIDEGAALLHRLLAAAAVPDGVDPRPFRARFLDALDDDLDVPSALDALDDLGSAMLSDGRAARPGRDASEGPAGRDGPDRATASSVLREMADLLGVDLDRPVGRGAGPGARLA
jgi:L-cysteine:1D-myo-inositol 2-amino-2-deoxy-alpha-D-glucopyranoside ligase